MGSATAYHLARGGSRVVGFDTFHPPHDRGSSHGLTRIIREAYFEHPAYVPLVQRAYQLWRELERDSGEKLLVTTGGLMLGPPDGALVSGALKSAREHRLAHELLTAAEVQARFPVIRPDPHMVAVYEPRAGIVFPERAIATHLSLAKRFGAELRYDEPVIDWAASREGVRVKTGNTEYTAEKLVISAGAWLPHLVPSLRTSLQVERQVLFWFAPGGAVAGTKIGDPDSARFAPEHCPIFICEHGPGHYFYGFPDLGDGVKVAAHHEGIASTPEQLERTVSEEEITRMRQHLEKYLPGANGELKATAVCMYTNTPDEHFVIDFHPQHSNVLILSPCSGHGFKFSPVIGEVAAQMLNGAKPVQELSLFGFRAAVGCGVPPKSATIPPGNSPV
jgi:sarcosine oxidase